MLDCRDVNRYFRKPPKPEMAAAESVQRLENSEGSPVYIAEADIQNCFYQIGLPPELCSWFCFEGDFSYEDLCDIGLVHDIDGHALSCEHMLCV